MAAGAFRGDPGVLAGITSFPVCMANSAAILCHPQTAHDWIRPGIMLYGGSPFDDAGAECPGLKPAATLRSEVIAVHDIRPGERRLWRNLCCRADRRGWGWWACGYGDGYPRHAPTGTPILVNGHRTRTLGVFRWTCCLRSDHLPEAGIGSPVVL